MSRQSRKIIAKLEDRNLNAFLQAFYINILSINVFAIRRRVVDLWNQLSYRREYNKNGTLVENWPAVWIDVAVRCLEAQKFHKSSKCEQLLSGRARASGNSEMSPVSRDSRNTSIGRSRGDRKLKNSASPAPRQRGT